jgi:hypothetical protein
MRIAEAEARLRETCRWRREAAALARAADQSKALDRRLIERSRALVAEALHALHGAAE